MNRKSFRHSVSKHERVITVLGALIVFITFIVNEVVREHVKDFADEVASAKTLWLISDENTLVRTQLYRVERRVIAAQTDKDRDLLVNQRLIVQHSIETIGTSIAANARLVDALGSSENKQTVHDLNKRLKKYEDDYKPVGTRVLVELTDNGEVSAHTRQDLDNIEDEGRVLSEDVYKFGTRVIDDAEKQERRSRYRFEIISWISYCLYAVGWGLTLFARLFGIKASEAD